MIRRLELNRQRGCAVFFNTLAGALAVLLTPGLATAVGGGGPVGDFNGDGLTTHADYTILADNFSDASASPGFPILGDIDGDGVVDEVDQELYEAAFTPNFNGGSGNPLPLPLTVEAAASGGGTVVWTFVFDGVGSALAGDLNLQTDGAEFVSIVGGPAFADLPGSNVFSMTTTSGVEIVSPRQAFAALGTTPGDPLSGDPLLFLTLETDGVQETTLSFSGDFGYEGSDFLDVGFSVTFTPIPEPASAGLVAPLLAGLGLLRRR